MDRIKNYQDFKSGGQSKPKEEEIAHRSSGSGEKANPNSDIGSDTKPDRRTDRSKQKSASIPDWKVY